MDTAVGPAAESPSAGRNLLLDASNGVFSSLGLFETPEQGMESTKFVATWIRDEKLETLIPNEPKITSGQVVAHGNGVVA